MNLSGSGDFTVTWVIENFSFNVQRENESLVSPTFISNVMENTEWVLIIFPHGSGSSNDVGVYLSRKLNGPETVKVDFEISFLDFQFKTAKSMQLENHLMSKNFPVGFSSFVTREEIFKKRKCVLLRNDTLIVRCSIFMSDCQPEDREHCWARTRIGIEEMFLTWSIRNFCALPLRSSILIPLRTASPRVLIRSMQLHVTQVGEIKMSMLVPAVEVTRRLLLTCRTFLLNFAGNEFELSMEGCYLDQMPKVGLLTWDLKPFLTREYLISNQRTHLNSDALTLRIEVRISSGVEYEKVENTTYTSVNL